MSSMFSATMVHGEPRSLSAVPQGAVRMVSLGDGVAPVTVLVLSGSSLVMTRNMVDCARMRRTVGYCSGPLATYSLMALAQLSLAAVALRQRRAALGSCTRTLPVLMTAWVSSR